MATGKVRPLQLAASFIACRADNVAYRERLFLFATGTRNTLGTWELLSPTWSSKLTKILGLSLALLLFGSGIWANVNGGSLSQNTGAWVSHR